MSDTVLSIIINVAQTIAIIAIVFYLAYRFGWKKFAAYVARRQAVTMEAIREADEQNAAAAAIQAEAEQKLKDIHEESAIILARAEDTAHKISIERNQKLNEELSRKRDIAEKQLEQDRIRLEQEMEKEVIERATQVASQFLSSKATPESTEAQIEEFLVKMGDK